MKTDGKYTNRWLDSYRDNNARWRRVDWLHCTHSRDLLECRTALHSCKILQILLATQKRQKIFQSQPTTQSARSELFSCHDNLYVHFVNLIKIKGIWQSKQQMTFCSSVSTCNFGHILTRDPRGDIWEVSCSIAESLLRLISTAPFFYAILLLSSNKGSFL